MKNTGVFATEKEAKEIREAFSFPVIYLSGGTPLGGNPREIMHKIALSHGLPEINGYYGLNEKNEFIVCN